MAIRLFVTGSSGTADITHMIPTLTWSGDISQCARTLEFGLLSSYTDKNIPVVACGLGNGVLLTQDDRTLFGGYVFARQKSTDGSVISFTCFDRGIYLKRNEASYKFSSMTPEAVTKRICADFGITAGSLAVTGVKISRNFIGVSLYRIVQTAYTLASAETGKKYQIRFEGAALSVIEKKVTDETLIIEGGSNLMSASATESVESMVNQVKIYNSNDSLVATIKNEAAVKLYGLMQSCLKQADKEDKTAEAKKLLKDNAESQIITVENLGNIANVTGGTVVVREPYTGLYGLFYIDSDVHTWKNGLYFNKLTLNFKNMMDEQEAGQLINKDGNKTDDDSTWDYLYRKG